MLLNNANELDNVFNEEQLSIIEQWFHDGGDIVGLRAALIHQQGWPWFSELAGCNFESDSNFQKAKVRVDTEAENHPAVNGFG